MSRKAVLYIAGGAVVLIIAVILLRSTINKHYSSEIPTLSNLHTLSQPVQEQISDAIENVQRKPSAEYFGQLGMVYHSSANYEEAAQCYQMAIRRKKSAWIWNYYAGYLHMEMGNSEAAIENFKRVIEKNPDTDLALYYMGAAYRNQREIELAEASFGKIADSNNTISAEKGTTRQDHFPLSAYAKYQLSRIYMETERDDLAEKTLKEILQANRTFGPAYRLLGNIYSSKGDLPTSERYGARANDLLAFAPPVDTLIDRLDLISRSELFLLKKIDEAERGIYDQWTLRLVNHALQYLPDNKYLISKAVNIFLWMDLNDEAIDHMDRHISHFQDDFNELSKTGLLFMMNGLYPQVIDYLTRAVALEPENVEIQKELALCYASAGKIEKSHDILNDMLEKNQHDPNVLADIADVLFFNLRETEAASGIVSRLEQQASSYPKVQKVSAGMAEKDGNLEEAITLYESAIRGNPEDIVAIKRLGDLLFGQKMWEKAILLYREALQYHPNEPYFLEKLGTLLALCPDPALQDVNESIEYLERAFIHMSSQPNTLLSAGRSLAVACAKLGDKRNAIKTIEQTIEIGRYENITSSSMTELENLHRAFQGMDN